MATVEKRQFTICVKEIDSKYDVMLSYQWDSKQEIIELEKALQKKFNSCCTNVTFDKILSFW